MDLRTKYYRPNLAKGTAGAAKTTPTPIRRSAAKWAMPVDNGGSGGNSPIIDIKVSGTSADAINAALAQYLPLEVLPSGTPPKSIDIDLLDHGISGSYTITVTPGADYFCAVAGGAQSGKGESVTVNVASSSSVLEFSIMAATKEDGSDLIGWGFSIAGNGK